MLCDTEFNSFSLNTLLITTKLLLILLSESYQSDTDSVKVANVINSSTTLAVVLQLYILEYSE